MRVATQRCNNLTASNKLKTSIKETKQPTPWEGNKKKKKKKTTLTRGCAATTELYKFLSIVYVCECVGGSHSLCTPQWVTTHRQHNSTSTVLLRNSLKLFWIHPDTHPFTCQYSIMRGVSLCSSSAHVAVSARLLARCALACSCKALRCQPWAHSSKISTGLTRGLVPGSVAWR